MMKKHSIEYQHEAYAPRGVRFLYVRKEDKMIKTKRYRNEPRACVSIDPSDEEIVIVSSKGQTSIWINGKEAEHVMDVTFSHFSGGKPVFDIKKKVIK